MKNKIKKAVFPVAGMGTRFLPATKANPKEMLPIVDKPLIQYAAEEAIAAGCEELIFVTSSSKRAIEDHFDKNYEMETELEKRGKKALLKIVREVVPPGIACVYVRQPEALGLGHAVLCAKPVVGDEPFAVILADDLIDGDGKGCLQQMVSVFKYHRTSVLGVEEIPHADTDKYGIVKAESFGDRISRVKAIVEKPAPAEAPSNLAVVGRYILTSRIFDLLETTERGAGGEIQLTDAMARLIGEQPFHALKFDGVRHDCGDKAGFVIANAALALERSDIGPRVAAALEERLSSRT